MNDARNEFVAPLGSATTGRLEFVRGAYNLTIHPDASTSDLYRARFGGDRAGRPRGGWYRQGRVLPDLAPP
jgi:hypothetical protein